MYLRAFAKPIKAVTRGPTKARRHDSQHSQSLFVSNPNAIGLTISRTDDNGERLAVDTERAGERLVVTTAKGTGNLDGCVMSFAYWNPEILRQSRLLNSQTGEYEAVKITALGDASIMVRGTPTAATHYRITGPKNPIDLWYSAAQEWLALESTVAGGRRLRYRLDK